MKKIITLILLSALAISLTAQNIDVQTAEKVANAKIARDGKSSIAKLIRCTPHNLGLNTVLFYEMELSPSGYMIVSGNHDLPPVICYSYSNNIDKEGNLISIIKKDLKIIQENIVKTSIEEIEKRHNQWNEYTKNNFSKKLVQQWPEAGSTASGGWVETNWTQNAPYNNFCPVDPSNDSRSIAGCPSVAMGMIVDFHRTTNNVNFDDGDDYYHNYAGRNYWIDDDYLALDFPSWPMLNGYLLTLEEHYNLGTSLSNNDKAALVYACGAAAKQVYTSSGSGTFSVSQAYDAYIKFHFGQAQLLDTSNIADSSFYKIIIQNIKDTLPVHLAIVDSLWNSGHNIVADGYNTDGFFHFNFGWGGSGNGWYLMLEGMPYNMNFIEGAVVNIKPSSSIGIPKKYESQALVYPNPAINKVEIIIPEKISFYGILTICNNLGQEIFSTTIPSTNGNTFLIDVSTLKPGIYNCKLNTDENSYRLRIVKI